MHNAAIHTRHLRIARPGEQMPVDPIAALKSIGFIHMTGLESNGVRFDSDALWIGQWNQSGEAIIVVVPGEDRRLIGTGWMAAFAHDPNPVPYFRVILSVCGVNNRNQNIPVPPWDSFRGSDIARRVKNWEYDPTQDRSSRQGKA